jgi:hypothetical protein
MRENPQTDLLFPADPAPQLVQLAHLEQGDRPIVSCYLDTRCGIRPSLTFLNEKAAHIRASLKGVERLEFDTAIEIIRRNLDDVRDGDQGIAVFTRGALSDRHLTLVKTPTAPDNRLVYGRSPEILPLVALYQNQPAGHLLVAQQGRFELLRTDLDADQQALCTGGIPGPRRGTDRLSGTGAALVTPRDHAVKTDWPQRLSGALEVSTVGACGGALLLAGDADALLALSDRLPDEATGYLVGCIELAQPTDRRRVLELARNRLTTIFHAEARRLAHAVVEQEEYGDTVVGFRAVLDTLRDDAADTVVLSDWDRFGHGLPWESKVEICFEALRRDARVILCDSLRLRSAGGVGCLLRSAEQPVQRPRVAQPGRLQQVA